MKKSLEISGYSHLNTFLPLNIEVVVLQSLSVKFVFILKTLSALFCNRIEITLLPTFSYVY